MKVEKRILALLLTLILMVSVFAGCVSDKTPAQDSTGGQKTTESTGSAKSALPSAPVEKPVLKHLGYYDPFDPNTDPVAKALEEMTGYKVEYFMLPNENATEKLNLEMSSGAEYDSLKITRDQYATLAAQGALMELDDLIDKYGPNLKAVIGEESWKAARVNGKLYGIPEKNSSDNINYATVVRKDILDELNLPVPTTIDEFYNTLKVIKEKKGIIPLTGNEAILDTIASAFGSYTQWTDVNGELLYRANLPGTKECIEFMQKLYKENLIDKEWPINKAENKVEKFTSGKAAMALFAWWDAPSIKPAVLGNFPQAELAIIQPLKGSNNEQGMLRVTGISYFAAIPKNSKHAEDVIKWYNAKLETETHKYFTIGKEGTHFTVDNGKYKPILPIFADERNNSSWYLSGIDEKNYPEYWKARVRKNADLADWYDEIMKDADNVGKYDPLAFAPALPAVSKYYQSVLKSFSDECIKIIVGDKIDTYDEFLVKLGKEGLDEMTKEVNEWYKSNK